MILLYAIIEATPPTDPRGLDDQPLEFLPFKTMTAAFTRHSDASMNASAQNVLGYEQVLEQLMLQGPVLPFRFGTCFSDEAAAARGIQKHESQFTKALEQVRGCVEMGVRAALLATESPQPTNVTSGREYMMSRLARQSETQRLVRSLHEPLAAQARQSAHRIGNGDPILHSGAYLVPRDAMKSFRSAIERLCQAHPQLRILCTGPWPPYHFVPDVSEAQPS